MHSSKTQHGRIRAAQSRVAPPLSSASASPPASVPLSPAPSNSNAGHGESEVSTASPITSSGRAVAPLPLQTPSTYQSLVSTLSALGPIASGSTRTVGYWGKQAYEQLASTKRRVSEGGTLSSLSRGGSPASINAASAHVAPAPDVDRTTLLGIDEDEGEPEDDEHTRRLDEQLSASIHHRPSSSDDPVRYSAWDALPNCTRILIQISESGRLKLWDASSFSELVEVINIDIRLIASDGATPLSAKILPLSPPLDGHVHLGILTSDSAIIIYSTASHRVVKRLSVSQAGQVVDFQVNERFLVAATVQPLALHIWSLPTFEAAPFSPLLDVAAHPYEFTPVYCLSSSRLLAYVSTTAPASGGSGIIATSGWNESDGAGQASNSMNGGQSGNVDYGETARRWGEGMMSHVKAVTDYGYSRYYGTQTPSGSTGLTPPSVYQHGYRTSPRPVSSTNSFSKSAPHSASPFHSRSPEGSSLASSPASGTTRAPPYSPRPTNGGSTSSTVVVLDLVASSKSSSLSRPSSAQRSRSPHPQYASRGTEDLIPIAHFRPSKNHQLTLLSINPNGTLILTSSSEGHSFHVFELRPPSLVGNSTVRTSSPSRTSRIDVRTTSNRGSTLRASNPDLKVWHRYRLNRGLTVARTIAAQWSPDSRFVLVSTSRGTVHVYPVHPLGGKPTPESHLPGSVKNPKVLMPLSITVNTVARIKAPRLPSNGSKDDKMDGMEATEARLAASTSPPNMLFVPMISLPMQGLSRSAKANTGTNSRTVALVLFYPHLHSVLQTNLHLSASPKTASPDAPLSTRVTSQAVSGLTQMMRNKGSALPTFESEVLLARQEWQSQWPLALEENTNEEDVRVDLAKITASSNSAFDNRKRNTSAHEAEIESFSHAPGVLPRSIYLAQTVTFQVYPPTSASKQIDIARQFSLGSFDIAKQQKVTVREEVSHRFGSRAGEPFDESTELHSAMHTILDASNLSSSNAGGQGGLSPSSNSPAFPNGYGKSSTSSKWLPSPSLASLPIPIGISPSTVRQAATKVRKYSSSLRSPRLHAVGSGHSLQSSTLSFEDDDAVLAQAPPDMLEIDEEGVDLGQPQQVTGRPDKYGSPSPAPVPSLSVGTASSAESHGKSTESPSRPVSQHDMSNSPALHASMADEEVRNEGEWDSFKLEGIDDEDDLKSGVPEQVKAKSPSPLLSHAMLPLLAAKSEQVASQRMPVKELDLMQLFVPEPEEKPHSAAGFAAFAVQKAVPAEDALDLASKPLEPELMPTHSDVPLISPTIATHREATPSPLSSSPAVSSAAEFSASPATAGVLAKQKKKKAKKGK